MRSPKCDECGCPIDMMLLYRDEPLVTLCYHDDEHHDGGHVCTELGRAAGLEER